MSHLNAKGLLAAGALKTEAVELPDGAGTVLVRELSVGQRSQVHDLMKSGIGGFALTGHVVAMACVGEDGAPLFESPVEIEGLSPRIVAPIEAAVLRMSGMGAKADGKGGGAGESSQS